MALKNHPGTFKAFVWWGGGGLISLSVLLRHSYLTGRGSLGSGVVQSGQRLSRADKPGDGAG